MKKLLVALVLFALGLQARAQDPDERRAPWPPQVVELARSLPIQDGGRIKPLSTFASFTLLRLNGKRSVTLAEGERLSAVEWLLDTLYFPQTAARHPAFLVQNSEVLDNLGLSLGKHKRDRYSFLELQPGLSRLMELAHQYGRIEDKDRSSVQEQTVNLAENVMTFVRLSRHETLAIVPPEPAAKSEEWKAPTELGESEWEAGMLARLDALGGARSDFAAFERELSGFHERVVAEATARGEYGKVALEIRYYDLGLLTWSLTLFGLACVAVSVLWLKPRNKVLYALASAGVFAATLALIAAIAMRCTIRGRPPVSTLYETVLFVTAVGSVLALALEWINRQRIAISVAAFLGLVGLFVANGYETLDKKDTMPSLVAVLDTNFWLSTHVTAITIGYSAGMLAALLANVYLLGKLFRRVPQARPHDRSIARMVYGVLCFGMIFSTVGTILGGIWANESWGRFWGWDPKENGALLIVLSQIAILHGRLGGYLREHGLCMAAAFGGSVVAFSWWGVNLLGVGLHSYGFTSGIHTALWSYYAVQWSLVSLGGVALWRERRARKRADGTNALPGESRKKAASGEGEGRVLKGAAV